MGRFHAVLRSFVAVLLAGSMMACASTAPAEVQVLSVSVSLGSPTLTVGQTGTAVAVVHDQHGNVVEGQPISWSSSNQSIASVGTGAQITALAAGSTQITATIPTASGSATLTVSPVPVVPVASVGVTLSSTSLTAGQSTQATATTRDANGAVLTGRAVAWSSDNTAVATVSSTGLVSSLAAGTAHISAASEGKSGSATLTVTAVPPAPVASVSVTLSSPSLTAGQSTQATATTKDANGAVLTGRAIAWSTNNSAVATVSASGLVTAVSAGSAQITATSEGQSGSATLTVTAVPPAPVATVTVSLAASSLTAGQTTQATATTKDASGAVLTGRAIAWSSDNTAVATVSASGLVTSVAAGTAHIIATSEGKSGSATLTVTAASTSAAECATPRAGWIFCDDFETNRLASYFEYNTPSQFLRSAGTGYGGSVGMQATYVTGQAAAGSLALAIGRTPSTYFKPADAGTANYREIYWRFYYRREAGWVGNGAMKLTRAMILAKADWSQAMIAHGWTSSSDDRYLMIDPASGTDANGNVVTVGYNDFANLQWLGGANSAAPEEDQAHVSTWACYEYHVKLNDAGQSNGVFEFRVNGQMSAQKTGLNFVSSYNAFGINAVLLENFVNTGAPAANKRTFDNFVVSTLPIGC